MQVGKIKTNCEIQNKFNYKILPTDTVFSPKFKWHL